MELTDYIRFIYHREKLNRKFFAQTQEIDDKKLKDSILQKKLNAMPKWQKEDYLKKNPESLGKHKQLIHKLKTEERALHEAYQILLSEHHIRKKLRKRYPDQVIIDATLFHFKTIIVS